MLRESRPPVSGGRGRAPDAISLIAASNPLMGHPGAIAIDPVTGHMTGAHDPRSDGLAAGL